MLASATLVHVVFMVFGCWPFNNRRESAVGPAGFQRTLRPPGGFFQSGVLYSHVVVMPGKTPSIIVIIKLSALLLLTRQRQRVEDVRVDSDASKTSAAAAHRFRLQSSWFTREICQPVNQLLAVSMFEGRNITVCKCLETRYFLRSWEKRKRKCLIPRKEMIWILAK